MSLAVPEFKQQALSDLLQAVESSSIADINKAVAKGADINGTDAAGRLALQIAAHKGDLAVVNRLLEHGCNVKAKGGDGHTAVHTAAAAGHEAVLKRLMQWDAPQPDELAAAAVLTANQNNMRLCAIIMKKLSQIDQATCTGVLQNFHQDPDLMQRLDQAIMEAWVADTNNQQQHQEEIQRHQAMVDAKASSVQQLLINVAQLARQQQHVAQARQRGA